MKNLFLKRVLWLIIPLLTMLNQNAWGATYTSVASLTDGKSYILVAGGYAIKAKSSTSNWIDGTDVSDDISDSTLTTTATDIVWVAKKYTSGGSTQWSFKNGTNYIQNNSGTTYRNMTCGATESKYTISSNKIYSTGSDATDKYLNYVASSGFRMYNSNKDAYIFTFYELNESCSTKPTVGLSLTSVSATASSITATVPISAIGGCNITENGLVYSTSNSTPTVGGTNCTKVTTTACGGTAADKEVTITGLTCETSYYVRGYATNTAGTSYTNVKTQSTSTCPKYTVTLMDDSDTRTQASYGAAVTLPSRTGCTGYTFAGWTKSWVAEQSSWTTTAPTIISAGSYTPAGNENLYPVYTKTESGGSGFSSYTKVSSAPSDWSGKYLISDGTLTATGDLFSETALKVTTLTPGTTEYTAYEFTITKNGDNDNYYIITPNGEDGINYVGYNSSTSLQFTTSTPATNSYLWTCSTSDPMILNVATDTRYIGVGTESKTDVFKAYSTSGTNGKCYLYKRIEGGSITSYISVPDCCTPLGQPATLTLDSTAYSITATWTATSDGNETGYSVQLYDNSGGDKGSAIGDPVSRTSSQLTYTFGAKSPAGSRLTANHKYYVGVTPTYSGAGDFCTTGTEKLVSVTTAQVYTVTYNANGGTVTTLPSGGTYDEGDEVTVAAKPATTTKSGHSFTGWNTNSAGGVATHYDADGTTTFDMPAANVTLYAEWTAKKYYYVDRMHGNSDGEHTIEIGGVNYGCYIGEATHTTPDPSDNSTGSNSCVTGHSHFLGWVISTSIGAQGQLLSGYTIIAGDTEVTAGVDGRIYYAVWAEE